MKARMMITTLLLVACLPLFAGEAVGQESGNESMALADVSTILESETERSALSSEEWKDFGRRITEALESDNEGVQRSALRLSAYYGDKLQMGRQAAISAVRLYRDNPDPNVRRLAVVAIARINHPWGIDFLTRSLAYEDSAGVEKLMRNALQEVSQEH